MCEMRRAARSIKAIKPLGDIRRMIAIYSEFPQYAVAKRFVAQLMRDEGLTDRVLAGLKLNERQTLAFAAIRKARHLTNADYRRITGATRPTAKRDLEDMVYTGILELVGAGRGTFYRIPEKWLGKGDRKLL